MRRVRVQRQRFPCTTTTDPLDNRPFCRPDFTRVGMGERSAGFPRHSTMDIEYGTTTLKSSKKKKERRKEKGRRGFEHAEENNRRTGGGVLSTTIDGKVDLELRNRSTLPRSPPALDHVATGVPRSRFFLPSTLAFPFWRGKGKLREPEFFQNVKSWPCRIYRESLLN